jgi:hypothetical protein
MRDRFYFNSLTDPGLKGTIVPFLQHDRAKGWDTLAPPQKWWPPFITAVLFSDKFLQL